MRSLTLHLSALFTLVLPHLVSGRSPAPFNTSFTYEVDGWSPMFRYWPLQWEGDRATGDFKKTFPEQSGIIAYFAGVSFNISGTAKVIDGKTNADEQGHLGAVTVQNSTDALTRNATSLGSSDLTLSVYRLFVDVWENVTANLHSLSIEVPALTQAKNLSDLQARGQSIPAVLNGDLNPVLSVELFTHGDVLRANDKKPPDLLASPETNYTLRREAIVLRDLTELHYSLPPNTTLVNVSGPVANDSAWEGRAHCFAYLEPPPEWWSESAVPITDSVRAEEKKQQPMFVFPVDPRTQHTLVVAPWGSGESCPVSDITTYSYFLDPEQAANAATNPPDPSADDDTGSSVNTRALIAGVVSGVGGLVLVLLVIVLWYTRHRLRLYAEVLKSTENAPIVETHVITPFVVDPHTESTMLSPDTAASSTAVLPGPLPQLKGGRAAADDPLSLDTLLVPRSLAPPSPATACPTSPVAEHEEDAEDALRARLPPMYNEEWAQRSRQTVEPATAAPAQGQAEARLAVLEKQALLRAFKHVKRDP